MGRFNSLRGLRLRGHRFRGQAGRAEPTGGPRNGSPNYLNLRMTATLART
jgi:hypothetical protein